MQIERMQKDLISELERQTSGPVKALHTHISMVLLTDSEAIKIKKPVNFGFLDFTSLSSRHFFCHQELILNRRMAKDIYRDVVPIRLKNNYFSLKGGPGEICEYAIVMKRIPDDCLMKSKLINGELDEDDIYKVSSHISKFHSIAKKNNIISEFGTPQSFRINTDENFEQTKPYIGKTISQEIWSYLQNWTDNFYTTYGKLFDMRVRQQRIRDCHGDLHMEHIAIINGKVVIFDCIEFNDRFRFSDTLNDIGFLIMDMDYHHAHEQAELLWNYYRKLSEESDVEKLLTFYKTYRAFVRGKVISFQVTCDMHGESSKDVAQKAKSYFELAYNYAKSVSV